MSRVIRSMEERLAQAAASGELDTPHLHGKPLDLDTQRGDGWWADQFARRELSHDRRIVAVEAAAKARAEFWRCETIEELRDQVASANQALTRANINMIESDQLELFDRADIERRWRNVRR